MKNSEKWAAAVGFRAVGLILALLPMGTLTVARAAAPMALVTSVATPGSIHYYVEQGDLAKIKALLKAQPKLIEQHQSFLGTPLATAAADGKLEIVRYLIAQHAYVNGRCADQYDSQTVLQAACTGGAFPETKRMAIVKALVDAGALVRVVDRSGYTALHTAAYYGHADVVNYLVDKGADLLAIDQDGRTPFTEAMRGAELWDDWRLLRFVRVEIAAGADVNARTASGATMLSLAAQSGRVHTLGYLLLQNADLNARDRENRTALEVANEYGQTDAAQILQDQAAKLALTAAAANSARATPTNSGSTSAPEK